MYIQRIEDPLDDCYITFLKAFCYRSKADKRAHSGWFNFCIKSTCTSQNRFWSRNYEGGSILNLFFVCLIRMHTCLFILIKMCNANVERSLSDKKNTLTSERTKMTKETLEGLRRMEEYSQSCGGVHDINTLWRGEF